MNVIDQRILIPTSPDAIWDYIRDLGNNPEWQADCRSVSFLTSAREGRNVRWRYASRRGREYVVEITAWYEQLGYEYCIVDGVPFKENRGRIRLQETPEGTIVEWLFRYEPRGLAGGIRNTFGTRRRIESTIVNSLWNLWRRVTEQSAETGVSYVSKSVMREAPDVEMRLQYQPRHTSVMAEIGQQGSLVINEPPVSAEDTRPHVGIAPTAETEIGSSAPDFVAEPDFVRRMSDTESEEPSTPPMEVATPVDVFQEPYSPLARLAETSVEEAETETSPTMPAKRFTIESEVDHLAPDLPQLAELNSEVDTARVSVFELFGVPKPSETPATKTVNKGDETAPASPGTPPATEELPHISPPTPVTTGGRAGMRKMLRRKGVDLRLPQ